MCVIEPDKYQRARNPRRGTQESAAAAWPPLARYIEADARLGAAAAARGPLTLAAYEFLRFGVKQAWACLFGAILLGFLILTYWAYPVGAPLTRYDFLFLTAIAIQVLMLWLRLETLDEAKVILIFHVIGTIMEVHKTAIGSWVYPEASLFRIGGVPLFTGFMYAAVGSYLARVWRLFDFRFTLHPPLAALAALSAATYVNFLTNHRVLDIRVGLILAAILLFARTTVYFKVWRTHRRMPLLLGLTLVALFIWFAENIGTATGTWLYPSQRLRWSLVPFSKLTSWFLLMIISYTLVAWVNGISIFHSARRSAGRP
ncbi:DUF817 domain-containing protein [Methylobacterium soli]|uniref:DUF817 domain-containing protein n=1 Tax=Methylobacterium soli TaxID=553447 RepID=A0A6L3T5A4_9HYPH|nr:DUF817 domain-containing protein [Methylobacterium soli]